MVKTVLNDPFGNGSYQLFVVIWGMVYYCLNHSMHLWWEAAFVDVKVFDAIERAIFRHDVHIVSMHIVESHPAQHFLE